ncbi:tellurite resistance protein TehB [Roseovarius sp. A-2]|uniref:glycosyltransferase n=1 Tax=Roseovarius sp. A-2 TaxID=1570360 RepID=UPI0009B51D4B|nr:glycosyltransferase [Roseovarius sp. A-2]GAW35002.1 tellurite resistance protein TehB [Roseovarius sp. A-2]
MTSPKFVAMIATRGRAELLLQRALPSIVGQIRACNRVLVIEDGDPGDLATRLQGAAINVELLRNHRTPGLSGALNTGLDRLARRTKRPDQVFLAFLDDDDAWAPEHLARIDACVRKGAHLVATPFLRLVPGHPAHRVDPPRTLHAEDFIERNPGIQGSNFAVRLDVLLEAGGFNEALPSCTDRDLCVRLSRRPDLTYTTTQTPSMYHHACSDRTRLSSRGSEAKLAGLDMFERIHSPLLPPGRREPYLARAKELFGWSPEGSTGEHPDVTRPRAAEFAEDTYEVETPHLLVGIIADDRRIESLDRLLGDLAAQSTSGRLAPPDVLLLENRATSASSNAFAAMVRRRRADLRIRVLERTSIDRLLASGGWRHEGTNCEGRLAIADARTLLQASLYHMARERPGCAVWIVDDDMRLDPLVANGNASGRASLDLGLALRRMKSTGADICIGSYTGAPPLPPASSIRGQLADVVWNLRRLAACDPDAPVPSGADRNRFWRAGRRDYYHDLTMAETDRLETPFALEPATRDERCSEALVRLAGMIPRILAGEAPMRPLVMDAEAFDEFRVTTAVTRGGNTFIFDPEALADTPNPAPVIAGRPVRRSDMIWALLQSRRFGRKVASVPVAVRHDRGAQPVPDRLNPVAIAEDLCGHATFHALVEGEKDLILIENSYERYREDRLAALRLSFHRIRGLAMEIHTWIAGDAPPAVRGLGLETEAIRLLQMFSPEVFDRIETFARSLGRADIRRFIASLERRCEDYSRRVRESRDLPALMETQRAEAVRAWASADGPLEFLGQGGEGVVVTDRKTVWKCFDRWMPYQADHAVPILQDLIAEDRDDNSLLRPTSMVRSPLGWVLGLPYEPSEPWHGGNGPGLVDLLADLHRAGLSCRNLHPKNLRVVDGTVRLVDYGADLHRLSDPTGESLEFARMCRRAWLCWRWWWRDDLDLLMRRSLHEAGLPELDGHEAMIRAVRECIGLCRAEDPTLTRALELQPARALDYGAGKGKQAAALARAGCKVTVWDPDPDVAGRLDALASDGVRRAETVADAVAAGPFELVICRRVACVIEDDALDAMLRDIRAAIGPDGRALVSLCHPAYAHRAFTAEAYPCTAPEARPAAPWTKEIRATGRRREERHRSQQQLRRLITRAGLRIVAKYERDCIEFERFETVSDLLVFELEAAERPQVSLLVKACAMDAEALEIQLRDLLVATEEPGGFREVVLTLDCRESKFLRPHATGDLAALRRTAERMRREGLIDHIVEPPTTESALRALNRRWFGLDLAVTHSAGGAATAALLAGFEACATPWVLHADIDMMIARRDNLADPVAEMRAAMNGDPSALTASFPIARREALDWSPQSPADPWRVESRIGLVNIDRIRAILPLPNRDRNGAPELSWHRAMDEAVRLGHGTSLRGGTDAAACIHPPNSRKMELDAWEEVRGCIARNRIPSVQFGQIEWMGEIADWRWAERHERFVFIICGRNVMPERFRRCWESVTRQSINDWGAVVIDDASSPWIAEETGRIVKDDLHRVTLLRRKRRAGLLANTVHAIRHLCADPDQVVVTLDADDCLIGHDVLSRLADAYDEGADLTVGSMLRTDKSADYPVRFADPCSARGGNVWQHLRSFRKRLFDAVPDAELRLDGLYFELASDWAFMIPMIERASSPVWIREPLYLHEPGERRDPVRAARREEVIARLMTRDRSDRGGSR